MEKEFIPYEQALVLKELEFDEPCLAYYNKKELFSFTQVCNEPLKGHYIKMSNRLCTPTYSQAFRWFREKYSLNANVYKWQPHFAKLMGHLEWEGSVTHFTEKKVGGSEYFKTYEEAELECLKKLIEIVKK